MRKSGAEILLRVRNLSVCRAFYRDVLALGAPATDSSFLCRFALAPDTFLTLVPIAESETAANAPWIFRPGSARPGTKPGPSDGITNRIEKWLIR